MSATEQELRKGVLGYWWLPGSPDGRVPGLLTWDPESGPRLEVLQSLNGPQGSFHGVKGDPQVPSSINQGIFGVLHGEASGSKVTLFDARVRSSKIRVGPLGLSTPEDLTAQRLFVGEHIATEDLTNIKSVSIKSHAISHWLNRSGLENNFDANESNRITKVSISVEAQEQIQIQLEDAVVEITHSWRSSNANVGQLALEEMNWFSVASANPMSWEFCNEILLRVQDLVSLASDQPVDIQELSMTLHANPNRGEVGCGMTVYDSRPREAGAKSPVHVKWAFRFLEGLELEDFRRWLTMNDRMRSHFRRIFITRGVGSANMYIEDKLNHVVATLQGCGRDLLGAPKELLNASIRKVFDSVGNPFTVHIDNFDTWFSNISRRRHELAHHDPRASDIEMTTYLELYWSGYWLCVFALLHELHVSEETSLRLVGSSWVANELNFKAHN